MAKVLSSNSLARVPRLKVPEISALSRSGTIRIFLGDIVETGALANLLEQVVGLGLGGGKGGSIRGLPGGFVGAGSMARQAAGSAGVPAGRSRLLGSDQDFTEPDLLGLLHLALVLVVELLLFLFVDGKMLTDFVADHLLGDDLVTHVLLEILVGNALGGGSLFQFLHAVQLHLLAHLVELLMRSVSAVMPRSLPFSSRSCWSMRPRKTSFSRSAIELVSDWRGPAAGPLPSSWSLLAGTRSE